VRGAAVLYHRDGLARGASQASVRWQTPPFAHRTSVDSRSPVALTLDVDKLGKLEDELGKLRAMIAAVVVQQET